MAPVTPPSRRVASAAWAERRPSTTTAATPAPMAASKAASQPSSISTRSTSEPTTPSTSRSSSRPPAPCRSASARSSASARAAVRWRASSASSADTWAASARLHGRLELGAARRQLGLQRRGRLLELVGLLGQQIGPHGGAGRPLLERADPRPERVHVLLLARGGAGHRLGARPAPGRWPGPARRRRAPRPSAPAAPSPRRRARPARPRSSARSGAPPASSSASAVISSLARRAASASSVETTSTSAAASRAATTPRPRSRSTPESPRARSTSPCTRPSALARSSSRREDSSAVVEVASASSCSRASCSSRLLVAAHGQVLRRRQPTGTQVGLLGPGEIPPHRQQLRRHAVVRAGRRRLPLEGPDLAPHLAHQVTQALEVLGRAGQPALGPLAAAPVLQDAGRLLDDGPPVLGPGVQHGVELALADDHVLLAADARVAQQLLDVEQPARGAVDGVLAVTGAEERPGDGDLGQVDGELARRVVDGERHLGPAQLGPRGGPGEDDVLHLGRAQRARALGAEHPGRRRRRRWTCRSRWGRPPR